LVQIIDEQAGFLRLELGEPEQKGLLLFAVTQNRDSMSLCEIEMLDSTTLFVRPGNAFLGIYLE